MGLLEIKTKIKETLALLYDTPSIDISLRIEETKNNHQFFSQITHEFYQSATSRHKKMPVFGKMTRGVGICSLPENFETYIKSIESSGHRNVKKAIRLGYVFERIDYNKHLDDIFDIRRSATIRQGKVSDDFVNNRPVPVNDPESNSLSHDYPYFGVFDPEGRMVAYAGCFLAGEVIELSHFYGHAEHQKNGVVPLLITMIAKYTMEKHPDVRVFMYGGYIGASTTLRRFKKKFGFLPYKVNWSLN